MFISSFNNFFYDTNFLFLFLNDKPLIEDSTDLLRLRIESEVESFIFIFASDFSISDSVSVR